MNKELNNVLLLNLVITYFWKISIISKSISIIFIQTIKKLFDYRYYNRLIIISKLEADTNASGGVAMVVIMRVRTLSLSVLIAAFQIPSTIVIIVTIVCWWASRIIVATRIVSARRANITINSSWSVWFNMGNRCQLNSKYKMKLYLASAISGPDSASLLLLPDEGQ